MLHLLPTRLMNPPPPLPLPLLLLLLLHSVWISAVPSKVFHDCIKALFCEARRQQIARVVFEIEFLDACQRTQLQRQRPTCERDACWELAGRTVAHRWQAPSLLSRSSHLIWLPSRHSSRRLGRCPIRVEISARRFCETLICWSDERPKSSCGSFWI